MHYEVKTRSHIKSKVTRFPAIMSLVSLFASKTTSIQSDRNFLSSVTIKTDKQTLLFLLHFKKAINRILSSHS